VWRAIRNLGIQFAILQNANATHLLAHATHLRANAAELRAHSVHPKSRASASAGAIVGVTLDRYSHAADHAGGRGGDR